MKQRMSLLGLMLVAIAIHAQVEVTTLAEVRATAGVTVHPDTGDIYISHRGSSALFFNSATTVVRVTPDGDASLFASGVQVNPNGNDFDSQGNLWQFTPTTFIWEIDPSGSPRLNTSIRVSHDVTRGVGLVIDADDNIFMTVDGNMKGVYTLPAGSITTQLFAQDPGFDRLQGITMDEQGNLYTVNLRDANVYRITPDGSVQFIAQAAGPNLQTSAPPNSLGIQNATHIVYARNKLYVAGGNQNQILEVTLNGDVKVLAGTGERGNQDGPADQATFTSPYGIAVSNDKRFLYVNGRSFVDPPDDTTQLRVIDLGPEEPADTFDFALAEGAWLNRNTDGEGILFDFGPSLNLLFAAWFTSTLEEFLPPVPAEMEIGGIGQRWMTSLMTLDGNISSGTLRARQGGAFDMPPTEIEASAEVGQISVQFLACDLAQVNYAIDNPDFSGSFEIEPLEKVVNPNGFSCESTGMPAAN